MTVWGTSRLLYAQVEIGQNRVDLPASFEVGQDFENLDAVFAVRVSASIDLSARGEISHSDSVEIYAHFTVKNVSSVDAYAYTNIKNASSKDLYAYFYRGAESLQDLYGTVKVQHSDSTDLYGYLKVERLHDSANLYAQFNVKHSLTQGLYASFEAGQGDQELFARVEVGQNAEDLPGIFELRNTTSQELYGYVGITHSIGLYGKLLVTHASVGDVQNLPAFFAVGQNHEDLFCSMVSQHPVELNLYGSFILRHTDTAELYGYVTIKKVNFAEVYGYGVVKNIGAQELFCRFHIGDSRDLFCTFITGVKDSVVVFATDDLTSFLTHIQGIGEGFLSNTIAEDDDVIKMVGLNSFKISSDYEAGGYKEIKFGWVSRVGAEQGFKDLYAKFEVMVDRFTLIAEKIAEFDVSDMEFADLDLNTHKVYMLTGEMLNAQAIDSWLYIYFNEDYTPTNYRFRGTRHGFFVQYSRPQITELDASRPLNFVVHILKGHDGKISLTGTITSIYGMYQIMSTGITHNVVQANLTKINLRVVRRDTLAEIEGFASGSRFRLFGYKS